MMEIILADVIIASQLYSVINILCSLCSVAITGKISNAPLFSNLLGKKVRLHLPKCSGIGSTLECRHLDILGATRSCSHQTEC